MSRPVELQIAVLNIVTQPHSSENYTKIFQTIFSKKPAISKKYYGDSHMSLKIHEIKKRF